MPDKRAEDPLILNYARHSGAPFGGKKSDGIGIFVLNLVSAGTAAYWSVLNWKMVYLQSRLLEFMADHLAWWDGDLNFPPAAAEFFSELRRAGRLAQAHRPVAPHAHSAVGYLGTFDNGWRSRHNILV
jgi:hypothetical protein